MNDALFPLNYKLFVTPSQLIRHFCLMIEVNLGGILAAVQFSYDTRTPHCKMVHVVNIREALKEDAENIYNIHTTAIRKNCLGHYSQEDVDRTIFPLLKRRRLSSPKLKVKLLGLAN